VRERNLHEPNTEQQAVPPPQEGEQRGSDGADIFPWRIASALIGGVALFAGLIVFMGYTYLRTYLGDLGIPARVLTFTPYQYALASSQLVVVAGLCSGFAVLLIPLWRYSRQPGEPSHPGLRAVPRALVRGLLGVPVVLLLSTTIVVGGLSDEVLPHLSQGGLKALTAVMWVSLIVGVVGAPLVAVFAPPRRSEMFRFALYAVVLLWAVAVALPIAFGHIDARLTLDSDAGTERATLLLVSDADVEGPWSSAEDGRIENAQVIFICEDYIYFLYRPIADADSPTVHVIAADLVSRIDFFPEE